MIARATSSVVYEATQLDLDRRVALKVYARGAEYARSLEHPNVVAIYTAGTSPHGDFVAMQLVTGGRTLADRLDGRLGARETRSVVRDVTAALEAAHRSGLVHGMVCAEEVLVGSDGRAYLTGLRPGGDEEMAADREALAALARRTVRARRLRGVALSAAGIVAAAAVAVWIFAFRGGGQGVPPALAGSVVLGSALPSSSVESLDCTGGSVSGSSPACSVAQTALSGRAVIPRRGGVIRRWTVRGAKGDLALEVLRPHGRAFITAARTPYITIADGGVHTQTANLPVEPGDLVGLEVAPGAAVGVRRRASGARTARWFGPLVYDVRRPERRDGTGFDHELLLRVEYEPGATWRIDGELRGRAAISAPSGEVARRFALAHRRVISVVRVAGRVAVDLVDDGRRVVRVTLTDADPSGTPGAVEVRRIRLNLPIVRVNWQNGDELVTHDYVVSTQSLSLLD